MGKDYIRYDLLAQEALRGVVRQVLTSAAQQGLPGEHHFYISVVTDAPGLKMSQRLREEYPEEMTIILQHQFWDLEVSENEFTVTLSFGGKPERLVVPYTAIKGFFDPSVQFGLEFVLPGDEESQEDGEAANAGDANTGDNEQETTPETSDADAGNANAEDNEASDDEDDQPSEGATVVSLDSFRQKG